MLCSALPCTGSSHNTLRPTPPIVPWNPIGSQLLKDAPLAITNCPLWMGKHHLPINILKCGPPLTRSLDPTVTASYCSISLFQVIVKLKWNQSKFAASTFSSTRFSVCLSSLASRLTYSTEILLPQATSDFRVVKHSDLCSISSGSALAASDTVLTSLAHSHLPESPLTSPYPKLWDVPEHSSCSGLPDDP